MSEQYKLLSKAVASGVGPCRWVNDESIPLFDRVLKKGFSSGFTVVADPHDAAKIFADFLAEWEHGDEYSAHLVVPHAELANGIIFQMQPGTPCPAGGYYLLEPHFFAVLVTNEEDQDARTSPARPARSGRSNLKLFDHPRSVALIKISSARLSEARELRDAALRLLDREGLDTILADRGTRYRVRQIELDGLSILHSWPGEQLLDIWEGPKVFSVAWDATGFLTVIAFRQGTWRDRLLAIAGSDAA